MMSLLHLQLHALLSALCLTSVSTYGANALRFTRTNTETGHPRRGVNHVPLGTSGNSNRPPPRQYRRPTAYERAIDPHAVDTRLQNKRQLELTSENLHQHMLREHESTVRQVSGNSNYVATPLRSGRQLPSQLDRDTAQAMRLSVKSQGKRGVEAMSDDSEDEDARSVKSKRSHFTSSPGGSVKSKKSRISHTGDLGLQSLNLLPLEATPAPPAPVAQRSWATSLFGASAPAPPAQPQTQTQSHTVATNESVDEDAAMTDMNMMSPVAHTPAAVPHTPAADLAPVHTMAGSSVSHNSPYPLPFGYNFGGLRPVSDVPQFLYHITSPEIADKIIRGGYFKPGSNGGYAGNGLYFGESKPTCVAKVPAHICPDGCDAVLLKVRVDIPAAWTSQNVRGWVEFPAERERNDAGDLISKRKLFTEWKASPSHPLVEVVNIGQQEHGRVFAVRAEGVDQVVERNTQNDMFGHQVSVNFSTDGGMEVSNTSSYSGGPITKPRLAILADETEHVGGCEITDIREERFQNYRRLMVEQGKGHQVRDTRHSGVAVGADGRGRTSSGSTLDIFAIATRGQQPGIRKGKMSQSERKKDAKAKLIIASRQDSNGENDGGFFSNSHE